MRNLSTNGFYISNKIGKAIADYGLIEDKDKIIVGVSGGKDSLALLKLLIERQRWAPVSYELLAAHVITDYRCAGCVHKDLLEKIFVDWNCHYKFLNVELVNGGEKKVSCFWCSWNRRKALFKLAEELGCNKIALAHHKDDVIETILLNLFYNGEISAINAKQPLFDGKITIIRPLVYVEEDAMRRFAKESNFRTQICQCPNSKTSKRALMKQLIADLHKGSDRVKSNIFRAPSRIKHEYLGLSNKPPLKGGGRP
jgi:tRNA 2-thiocytidine biosynthesis protein TtcA